MDEAEQFEEQEQQVESNGVLSNGGHNQMTYTTAPFHSGPVDATGVPAVSIPPQPLVYHQAVHHQQQQLQAFWATQMQEVAQANDFKNHTLPLARIKKIMKADEDVRMISAEAPVIFAKACEMFILELTLRSWIHTEENKRRTLQKNDIAAAIARTDMFDFLVDIIPREESKEEALGITRATLPMVGPSDYYYGPPPHPMGPGGMIMPVDQAALYGRQQGHATMPFMPWPQHQQQQDEQQPNGH